ncbi:MAG: sporulation protein YqfD [Firmicutes bacterium]|nr:sporulation protein YqfD [Bacillota bacterium]
MARRLLAWLRGWTLMRAEGAGVEGFVNAALRRGIELWRVRRAGGAWLMYVAAAHAAGLQALAGEHGLALAVVRQAGWPFLWKRFLRRRVLVAGVVATAALGYLGASFIWIVDVEGTSQVPSGEILRAAAQLGLYPGAFRPSVDADRVARRLPLLVPQVNWANVRLSGTRATIVVAEERRVPPEMQPSSAPADIVAKKDGVVTSVLALAGQPLVKPGDTVSRGQVLIRAEVEAVPPGLNPDDPAAPRVRMLVRARGTVRARVWYDRYLEVPAEMLKEAPTGRTYARYRLTVAGASVTLWGWSPVPFRHFRTEVERHALSWRGVTLPVEWRVERFVEVQRAAAGLDPGRARELARRQALAQVLAEVPPDARILDESAEIVLSTPTRFGVRVRLETEEDIGTAAERASPGSEAPPGGGSR